MNKIIVLATNNKHKIKEFQSILSKFDIEIRSVSDFGPIPPAIEDGETFDENAYKKASHTARILGLPAIADDSGLVVPAVNGEPGVYSARYAGENATDAENTQKLLEKMKGVKDRRASFKCVISLAVPSGPALTYEGQCDGVILEGPRGTSGFGYDPVFFFEEYSKTFAELSMEEKNIVSHRGKALAEFTSEIDKVVKWLDQRLAEEKPPKPDHSQFSHNDWSKS
ncbi:MAG: XTP/dITP diphosphatase [Desulfocapsaceae bacterium]|nr:XTP/dITP diphosphatase [Desulfocapsaceae bacterium]